VSANGEQRFSTKAALSLLPNPLTQIIIANALPGLRKVPASKCMYVHSYKQKERKLGIFSLPFHLSFLGLTSPASVPDKSSAFFSNR
jgi:hypothetical protein